MSSDRPLPVPVPVPVPPRAPIPPSVLASSVSESSSGPLRTTSPNSDFTLPSTASTASSSISVAGSVQPPLAPAPPPPPTVNPPFAFPPSLAPFASSFPPDTLLSPTGVTSLLSLTPVPSVQPTPFATHYSHHPAYLSKIYADCFGPDGFGAGFHANQKLQEQMREFDSQSQSPQPQSQPRSQSGRRNVRIVRRPEVKIRYPLHQNFYSQLRVCFASFNARSSLSVGKIVQFFQDRVVAWARRQRMDGYFWYGIEKQQQEREEREDEMEKEVGVSEGLLEKRRREKRAQLMQDYGPSRDSVHDVLDIRELASVLFECEKVDLVKLVRSPAGDYRLDLLHQEPSYEDLFESSIHLPSGKPLSRARVKHLLQKRVGEPAPSARSEREMLLIRRLQYRALRRRTDKRRDRRAVLVTKAVLNSSTWRQFQNVRRPGCFFIEDLDLGPEWRPKKVGDVVIKREIVDDEYPDDSVPVPVPVSVPVPIPVPVPVPSNEVVQKPPSPRRTRGTRGSRGGRRAAAPVIEDDSDSDGAIVIPPRHQRKRKLPGASLKRRLPPPKTKKQKKAKVITISRRRLGRNLLGGLDEESESDSGSSFSSSASDSDSETSEEEEVETRTRRRSGRNLKRGSRRRRR